MAAKKKSTAPQSVTLRSYDVGFGDCFLLTFHYGTVDRHILIDFGSTRLPSGKPTTGKYLVQIANQIATDCQGKLHAVVATHRHKDHISGFTTSKGAGPGDIIRALKPDLVIQPWTEHPEAARDAKRAPSTATARARRALFVGALHDMNAYAGRALVASRRLRGRHLKAVKEQLEFLGDDNELANRDAIKNLMTMSRRRRYVRFGDNPGLGTLLPGVNVDVLGPPDLEQTQTISKQRGKDKNQFWHLTRTRADFWAQQAGDPDVDEARPLFPRHQLQRPPWDARWFRYHAQREQAESTLSLVRTLDDQMNNTSVILLFSIGKTRLLFPGDAQYENWMYALSQPGVREKLAGVNLYKVGHHGSLNATPKDLWNGFTHRGGPKAKSRLISFLSTKDDVHGSAADRTEVPRSTLCAALQKDSEVFDTRTAKDALSLSCNLKL